MPDDKTMRGLLSSIANLDEHELSCDQSAELMHRYVDFRVYGSGSMPGDLKGVAQHLSVCPQCTELVEAIIAAARVEAGLDPES